MSHEDDDYSSGRPEWLTDETAWLGMGPRQGDERPRRPRYPNARWGATLVLELGKSTTLVVTPIFDDPWPIGFQLRFSTDGVSFSSTMPVGCGVDVTLTKSFDPKAGPAAEKFGIDPGQTQPMCQVIARSLTITMKTAETALTGVFVQAVACRLTALDCETAVPNPTPPAGITSTSTARDAAVTANTYFVPAAATRGLLVIVNQSAANLFVHLGVGVTITPGGEFATVVLPPNAFGGFEAVNYRGVVTYRFDADDADGYALITEGFY